MRKIDLIQYLPPFVGEYYEFQKITDAENPEFQFALSEMDNLQDNLFIMTAGESGLSRWEKMLNTFPSPDDTTETRRAKILVRINEQLPCTMGVLKNFLAIICGEDGFEIELLNEIYEINISLALSAKNNFNYIKEMLIPVIPANLIVNLKQLYNMHDDLSRFTHKHLSQFTHKKLREEVFS